MKRPAATRLEAHDLDDNDLDLDPFSIPIRADKFADRGPDKATRSLTLKTSNTPSHSNPHDAEKVRARNHLLHLQCVQVEHHARQRTRRLYQHLTSQLHNPPLTKDSTCRVTPSAFLSEPLPANQPPSGPMSGNSSLKKRVILFLSNVFFRFQVPGLVALKLYVSVRWPG